MIKKISRIPGSMVSLNRAPLAVGDEVRSGQPLSCESKNASYQDEETRIMVQEKCDLSAVDIEIIVSGWHIAKNHGASVEKQHDRSYEP